MKTKNNFPHYLKIHMRNGRNIIRNQIMPTKICDELHLRYRITSKEEYKRLHCRLPMLEFMLKLVFQGCDVSCNISRKKKALGCPNTIDLDNNEYTWFLKTLPNKFIENNNYGSMPAYVANSGLYTKLREMLGLDGTIYYIYWDELRTSPAHIFNNEKDLEEYIRTPWEFMPERWVKLASLEGVDNLYYLYDIEKIFHFNYSYNE